MTLDLTIDRVTVDGTEEAVVSIVMDGKPLKEKFQYDINETAANIQSDVEIELTNSGYTWTGETNMTDNR